MIYLVSNQKSLFESDLYQELPQAAALDLLRNQDILGADTETEGLDFLTKKILTIQLGTYDFQIVWDCTSVDPKPLKEIFEKKLTLWWNGLFDLPFLYKINIWPKKVVDLMLQEKLMYLGIDYKNVLLDVQDEVGASYTPWALKTAAKRYCDVELDKTVRGQIIKVGLTPEVIQYSGLDVKYEPIIYKKQLELLEEKDLLKAAKFENEFLKCLAYMRYCGVKLDRERWETKMASDEDTMKTQLQLLNEWVINFWNEHKGSDTNTIIYDVKIGKNYKGKYEDISPNLPKKAEMLSGKTVTEYDEDGERILYNVGRYKIPFGYIQHNKFHPYIYKELQGDLFSGFNTDPQCTINWSSSAQLIPLFELLGFNINTIDKETKMPKKSVSAKVILPQQDICDIAPIYLKYKKAEKVYTTYGQNWLDGIDIDGRIHPEYDQLGTATARLSSGGKSEESKKLNIQNLPRDKVTRSCFVSEKGNKWLSLDYQGQESRIIASVSNDPAMLKIYEPGECGDMHALVAYMSYPHKIPRETNIADIASLYKKERQDAKSIEFCINYGGNDATMVQNNGLDPQEAKQIYDDYMKGFPGVKSYQDYCRAAVMRDGYILMNPVTKHKAFINNWDELAAIQEEMKSGEFWEEYRELKKIDPSADICQKVRKYYSAKSDLEKASINYRIQNRGAMCSKLAGILFYNWIIEHNYQNIVKICLQVHDEYNAEAPEEIAEEVAETLRSCMEKGAKPFCTRLPLSADISRLDNGELPTCWLH